MYSSLIQLLCYCIGYTSNNDWSTSIIPLDQYQEKLQERRREWEASQPVEPEDRREIDRLTRVLQERERELQEERREKEQVRTRLQQQLEGRERQLQQAQQQGQERERQAREQVQDLQRQLQEREQQLQERERESEQQGQEREREIQQGRKREQDLQQQLQERERQAREREQDLQRQLQESQQQLQREIQQAQQQGQERERQVQDLQRQLQEREQQLEEREREFQERERQLEEQIQVAESSWVVNRREIIMTEVVLGKGGWGEVKVASFRGLKVAAKCLYEIIISPHNIRKFCREMNIASKLRHPNLLQFIGATTEGNPIILTELMPTSLRKELETGGLAYPAILSISLDVACALNYLHLFKPHPILHRDVSSANVLLQGSGFGGWRAKVSDYGTVSLQPLARTCNPGNPVYSAPESPYPRQHSPSMDVFSYGVLLIEMVLCQFPEEDKSLREAQIKAIKRLTLKNLIERCLIENYKQRPTMSDIIKELNESI